MITKSPNNINRIRARFVCFSVTWCNTTRRAWNVCKIANTDVIYMEMSNHPRNRALYYLCHYFCLHDFNRSTITKITCYRFNDILLEILSINVISNISSFECCEYIVNMLWKLFPGLCVLLVKWLRMRGYDCFVYA